MLFKTNSGGKKRVRKVRKYIIDWEEPSRSKRQFAVKQFIKSKWKNQVVFEELPVAGTKMSLDFYNATKKIAIEVQGAQHTKYVPHFHNNQKINFLHQLRRDKQKREFCEINNIKLIEIHDKDRLDENILKKIS
jgi:very-short-patch-repair endonuclease|tara:strand:- start:284 stop:685 length:402 start_codon:yes stop_codon:yes gene_type:complete